ncbi:MAG: hypothetical protein AMXMBFR64_61960 [Myxococcales bacterium]
MTEGTNCEAGNAPGRRGPGRRLPRGRRGHARDPRGRGEASRPLGGGHGEGTNQVGEYSGAWAERLAGRLDPPDCIITYATPY